MDQDDVYIMNEGRRTHKTVGSPVLVGPPAPCAFPLSMGYLAGYLRQHGEEPIILPRPAANHSLDDFAMALVALEPLVVGVGSLYPDLTFARNLVHALNAVGRDFPVVIGGQMVSPAPEFALSLTGADIAVVGEGEITLHEVVRALRKGHDVRAIPGLLIRRPGGLEAAGAGDYIEDLSTLPPVPYDLIPSELWLHFGRRAASENTRLWQSSDRVVPVHASRGCPLSCNFCYHHSSWRDRPMSTVIDEAVRALTRYEANVLCFVDDLALTSAARTQELLQAIEQAPRRFSYIISATFGTLSRIGDVLLSRLAETGCRAIGLGFESGSDRILRTIGKDFVVQTALAGLRRLRRVGIVPAVMFMVGQYTETRKDVEATMRVIRESVKINPQVECGFTITTPFPGSRLYAHLLANGKIRSHDSFYREYLASRAKATSDYALVENLTEMSDEEVLLLHRQMSEVYDEEKELRDDRG